jgi:LacI family transcriptional regulator
MDDLDPKDDKTPKPTMMDVAARAGVSQATVSLVLNGSPGARLADSTRARVREAAENLGYRFVSRGPRRTEPDQTVIAFIADEISTDPWMAIALDGLREKAWESGLTVTVAVTRGDREMESAILEDILRLPLAGIIYGTILTRRIVPDKLLLTRNTVLLNSYDSYRRLPSVVPDDERGGREATERLIRAGRKRIALINGQSGIDASADRMRGYRQALTAAKLSLDPMLVRPGNWEPSSGYAETHALMTLSQPPDAIFCANDMMALGCFEALKERGLRIPEDVAVVGFDDREVAQFTRPPLTTLVLPHYEMGSTAADILIRRARGGQGAPPQIKVACPLVERKSV